jgi:phage host-nuclease inhibitor protein Gam
MARVKGLKKSEIPTTPAKAMETLKKIGKAQDDIDEIKDDLEKQIREAESKVKELRLAADQKITNLLREHDKQYSLLEKYARTRKKSITSETRVERTEAGRFGWRYSPPFVQIAEGVKEADVIARCEELGLSQFVRVTKTLNRKAIRAHGAIFTVPGLSIVQDDEFFAHPKSKRPKKKNKTVIANV